MKKLIQTRMHNPPVSRGNCLPTVIACFMNLDSPEDVLQIQEKFNEKDWNVQLWEWLNGKGWDWTVLRNHLFDNTFYCVTGKTIRGTTHICIYRNGKLYHDPHPSGEGLITEDSFEVFEKAES